jgi:integrase
MTDDQKPPYDYRPIYALPYWTVIGEFIDDAVADASSASGRAQRALYPATVAFVLWCWQSRGTPLERARIFRWASVEEFIHLGMKQYTRGSKATHRASLSLMVEALNPAEHAPARRAIPRSEPTKPYTPPEIAALHSWATSQGTSRRRRDAIALLALGLGAGLATRELLGVRVADVDTRNDHLYVIVRESRPRVVPFLPEWQRPLWRIIGDLKPADWIFRPGRTGVNPGQITDFLQRARTDLDVRPSRMRTTWLVGHLTAGTPPRVLLRISGLTNLAALDKITKFVPKTGHTFSPTRSAGGFPSLGAHSSHSG